MMLSLYVEERGATTTVTRGSDVHHEVYIVDGLALNAAGS